MGLWSGTKSFVTKGLNIRPDQWMSLDFAQETFTQLKSIARDAFIPQKAKIHETFDEALDRLSIQEDDIEQRKKEFTHLYIAFTAIGLIILFYGIYMLIQKSYGTSIITVFLSTYAFAQAFKFHFWLFQIKNRKLGCSIKEWLNSAVHTQEAQSDSPSTYKDET